ncbi:RHS repeat domain-containing protein, partial [Chitinophaga costaii]
LYGSSRLGTWQPGITLTAGAGATAWSQEGLSRYELTNHLGNVLSTISDQRVGVDNDHNGTIDYYLPTIASYSDYTPFGMQMMDRNGSAGGYRYGFNGKENDNEVKGEGNQQDYGMRVYDPRVGRFLSVDPLTSKFSELTPYQYASNSVIASVDLDGKESEWFIAELYEKKIFGTSHLEKVRKGFTERAVSTAKVFINGGIEQLKDFANNSTFTFADPSKGRQSMNNEINKLLALEKGLKEVVGDYWDLAQKAGKGDEKAIGAIGFEVVLFALPVGEEAKVASVIPRGFKNAAQFAKVGEELSIALDKSGIKYKEIGVRGSAVSGISSKGGFWRESAMNGLPASDIDVFVTLEEDIPVSGGLNRPQFIHPDKMIKAYPELKAWSQKWTNILGREITPAADKPEPKAKPVTISPTPPANSNSNPPTQH